MYEHGKAKEKTKRERRVSKRKAKQTQHFFLLLFKTKKRYKCLKRERKRGHVLSFKDK